MKSTGSQFRSWSYVVDCASAILYILLKGKNGEAYNIADEASNISIRELAEAIEQQVYADNVDCTFLIPYSVGNVASYLMEEAQVFSTEYREDGILIHADCHRQDMERYKTYMTQ